MICNIDGQEVYNLYRENDRRRKKKILSVIGVKIEDLERVDAIQTESAEIVKADFDEIGSLIENNSVPQEFLKIYWFEVLKSWTVLRDEIEKIRQMDLNYMENFSKLVRQEYRKRQNKSQPEVVKDVIIKPAIEDFKIYQEGLKYIISVFFDIPIDETKFLDKVEIFNENTRGKIQPELSWNRENNSAVFSWFTGSDIGTSSYKLTIDKVQDTKGMQMEEAYSIVLPEKRP